MMKAVALFLACLPLLVGAQVLTVSENISLRTDTRYNLIGELGGQTLLFQDRSNKFEIQAFDKRMRESWTKELELDRRSPEVIGLVTDEEHFYLSYIFRERNRIILKVHKYNAAANLVDSTVVADLGFIFFTPNFNLEQSEDDSKLLLYYSDNSQELHAFSFDLGQMKTLWQGRHKPQDFFFNENFVQALIDDSGRMHLALIYNNFRSRRKEHYFLFYTVDNGAFPAATKVSLGDYLTYDVLFQYDNLNERIIGAGLYNERDVNRAKGYYYMNIDPLQPELGTLRTTTYSDDLVEGLKGEKIKENKGIEELSIRDMVLRRDGGLLLITERNRQLERRSGNGGRSFYDGSLRSMVDYYYEELIVQSIHPTGELHWENILHKRQYSQDDNGVYSSYFLLRTPSQLRFLFNDEIRFENTVSEYVINGVGALDRNSLFNTKNLELKLRFRDALQVSARKVIVPSERRNRLRLVKLEY